MSAYMHMGHDTENLVGVNDLKEFNGIILSPVNRTPEKLMRYMGDFRTKGEYTIVLDPQLYFPRSGRYCLRNQPYFPLDIDTSDYSSSWWDNILTPLSNFALELGVDVLASPVIQPKVWDDEYYAMCAQTSDKLASLLKGGTIQVLTTVMVNVSNLTNEEYVLRTASIISRANSAGYYLVLVSDVEPRHEFSDSRELVGAMSLIQELCNTRELLLVSHCSSDMLLFKVAGASDCASGKFFNLRRFTMSRFREPTDSYGGQLPYWFEHSLLTFLREADILRLKRRGYDNLLGTLFCGNYWANEIMNHLETRLGTPWLALSWRQYLSWFGKTESALSSGNAHGLVSDWLQTAEINWINLEGNNILFEEPRNNGGWIRPWRQALSDFAWKYKEG